MKCVLNWNFYELKEENMLEDAQTEAGIAKNSAPIPGKNSTLSGQVVFFEGEYLCSLCGASVDDVESSQCSFCGCKLKQ
jgi:hypothetical protein